MQEIEINDIVNMERYIEDNIRYAKIPGLISFQVGITDENNFRVGIIYKTHEQGKIIQTQMKDFFKETYDIDKIRLERLYNDNSPEKLYDIIFEVPEEKFVMIYMLSKIAKTI